MAATSVLNVGERVQVCLDHQEKLTVGEIEVLHGLHSRQQFQRPITFVEEQELRKIEYKLGLA
ncbi:MAG TPA: hypothetical protein VI895_14925 [Bdellovibrionota bacterium]|nr:hypothetical protein [Bdellovibrionota bacterium]